MAMRAKTTPATMIPILAPDVILTSELFKRSGRVSMANGRDQDRRDWKERKNHAPRTNQKNAPAARPLTRRDRREKTKTASLTGIQQQKYWRVPIVLLSKTRWLVEVSVRNPLDGSVRESREMRERREGRGGR